MSQMSIDDIRSVLRADMARIPELLAMWSSGEGPLAPVPILPADSIAPARFTSLAGTVRVASGDDEALTLAGLVETDHRALIAAAVVVTPEDLTPDGDQHRANAALAAYGSAKARDDAAMAMEVIALLGCIDDGGPAFGTVIGRPLLLADPTTIPSQVGEDPVIRSALTLAAKEELPLVGDLANLPWEPMAEGIFTIWAPFFAVVRTACVGLAMRTAQ